MLVLSRKQDEVIRIGDDISIRVVQTGHHKIRLGIEAPKDVPIHREEVVAKIAAAEAPAA